MMAGFLLARAGVDVIVLEKHADFFRDFRGDTIHPSTLRIMDELGLLGAFLKLPHTEARVLSARFGDVTVPIADFRHVPGPCKFIALMPQWDFLNFLAEQARTLGPFRLLMEAAATDLIYGDGRIAGVRAQTPQGQLTVSADLVIAADGRHSVLRERAGLTPLTVGVPIDVLWTRLSRRTSDPDQALGSVAPGGFLVLIDRGDYFQCALIIRKGGFAAIEAAGLEALRAQIATLAPFLSDRVGELKAWDQIKLLSVAVDRLKTWHRPGLLCIGDAAHAMSPVGGVGINLAIQDAVATANTLAETLRRGPVERRLLEAVQRRRELPTRLTQTVQVFVQNRVLTRVLAAREKIIPPAIVRVVAALPFVRRIPAYAIGVGLRPERVRTPATSRSARSSPADT